MSLILTRNIGAALVINGNIKITPIAVRGRQIRFAIDAPKDIIVDREEISIRREADKAAALPGQKP